MHWTSFSSSSASWDERKIERSISETGQPAFSNRTATFSPETDHRARRPGFFNRSAAHQEADFATHFQSVPITLTMAKVFQFALVARGSISLTKHPAVDVHLSNATKNTLPKLEPNLLLPVGVQHNILSEVLL
jgi:hypothetical protein